MRIERVDLVHVQVPLVEPFRISTASVDVKDAIICRVRSEGLEGVGESSPMSGSFYSADTPESCIDALRELLIPRLLGREISGPSEFHDVMADVPGNFFAKSGLEMALWDLEARRQERPLYELLGGAGGEIPSGVAIGIYDRLDVLLNRVEAFLADGYARVKIKIKPGWDVKPISEIRRVFGDIPLMVDANAAYSLEDAHVFQELDEFELTMFEQPLPGPALEDLATLQSMIKTPICLDESAETLESTQRAISMDAGRIVNIKLQRVGGLGPAVKIHDYCMAHDIPVWCGYMPELGVSTAFGIHLSTLPGFTMPGDMEPSLRWFVDDITDPLIEMSSPGKISVPGLPGLGFELDAKKVEKYKVWEESFRG